MLSKYTICGLSWGLWLAVGWLSTHSPDSCHSLTQLCLFSFISPTPPRPLDSPSPLKSHTYTHLLSIRQPFVDGVSSCNTLPWPPPHFTPHLTPAGFIVLPRCSNHGGCGLYQQCISGWLYIEKKRRAQFYSSSDLLYAKLFALYLSLYVVNFYNRIIPTRLDLLPDCFLVFSQLFFFTMSIPLSKGHPGNTGAAVSR